MVDRIVICRSNPVAPDPRVEKTARALHQTGFLVTILAWDRTGQAFEKTDLPGIEFKRLQIPGQYGSGMQNLKPLLRWQQALFRWLWQNRRDYAAIHACDFDTVIPAILMKWIAGKIVVYDIFDFYTDHVRLRFQWIRSALRWLDHKIIQTADAVILVDDSRRSQLEGTYPKRLEIIYNTPEDQIPTLLEEPGDSETLLRIAYIGLIQLDRGIQYLISLLSQHPEWQVELAGFGGDEEIILNKENFPANLTWHSRVPYQTAIALSARSDVLLATYDPAIPNNRLASPNKVFEAMMLSKPVVVAEGTGVDNLVRKNKTGIVVPYGDLTKLEEGLAQLAQDRILRKTLGSNGRRLYESSYTWKQMQARLSTLYLDLLHKSGI